MLTSTFSLVILLTTTIFIAVFDEVVEKIDDPQGRLTRLIKYIGSQSKEMIKHCIQQPAAVGCNNARSLLVEK